MIVSLIQILALTLLMYLPQQEPLGEYWGTAEEEAKYYKLVDVPLPPELAIEAGSFEVMPNQKQLAVATRRGDIFLVDGAFDQHPEPTFKKFASGLDEIFGMAYRNDAFYVTQQTEVTRIADLDGDGRADRFQTLSDAWGFRHYHEFAFGSKPDQEGNIWVALCLSKSYHSDAPFRGWCLKVTPDGDTIPVCSGIRSPCGIGPNEHGVMFYAESQGPWNGSCSLKVLKPGGFMGHPISFNWYDRAPEMGPAPVTPNTPSRLEIERERIAELVPYAVVFPYKRMGRSISGFMVDRTGGKFGPFENQIFIGDFSLGVVMRATTEQINGVWQGACYPFREGFDTGLLAVQFTPDGNLIAGGTNRGWPVRGPKAYAIQRLDWTGLVPFEIKRINVTPLGFDLTFTKPVDRGVASEPANYQLKTFTHIYRQGYGSPEVDQTTPRVTKATVSDNGLTVRVEVEGRVQGHVHDFFLPTIRSAEDERLVHASAYYTLNEIPESQEFGRSESGAKSDPDPRLSKSEVPQQQPSTDPVPVIEPGDKSLPLPGESIKFNGFDAFIMMPKAIRADLPWVWYAPTLPGLPSESERWMFEKFLAAGVAIAGIDVGESYGSPAGTKRYDEFYQYLVNNKNFNAKPCLLARSRGGLMLYNWAIENPNSVAAIAGIYPVCNLESYPGIERACSAFSLSAEQLKTDLKQFNPVDRLAGLAAAEVPIFHIHGDQDNVVPLESNSGLLAKRFEALGGSMKLKVVAGQGHNMWSGWFESDALVEFVLSHLSPIENPPTISENPQWLTFPGGDGPGNGKQIVLIAAEQEYRSEQSMPMLAKILAEHHGFDCTVLFSVNEQGQVDPTLPAPFKDKSKRHNIPGLEHLAQADCVIWMSRFMQLPDEQLQQFHNYFDSGKPLIALRTANHGFWGGTQYFKNGQQVSLRELLGGSFMGHHGGWHRESTQGIVVDQQKTHPILTGVEKIWGTSDVYRCHDDEAPFPDDCTALILGQPLQSLSPDAPPNLDKQPLPIAWIKNWTGNQGKESRIFHFTMGSAKDFQNAGVRKLTVNAVYWGLEMEPLIRAQAKVDPIGDYEPLGSGFNYQALGVRPKLPSAYK